jgi:hypothetical protein
MRERVFNLYLYIDSDLITELGAVAYDSEGTDPAKLRFLQSRAPLDYASARRAPVPVRYLRLERGQQEPVAALRYEAYLWLSRLGRHLEVFEELFEELAAPPAPLVCITPVVDGRPRIDAIREF